MVDRRSPRPLLRPGLHLVIWPLLRPGLLRTALAALLLAAGGIAPALASSDPSVCIDRANPLQSVDRALIAAIGRIEGSAPRIVSIDTRDGSDALNAKKPRTGFVIAGETAPPAFARLAPGTQVGVVYLTVPTTYFSTGPGALLVQHQYSTPASVLAALGRQEVAYALLWQPLLEQALARHHMTIHQRALRQPHANWSVVALHAPTQAGRAAARHFDAALARLAKAGTLARLVAPYHTP
ncbi:MAG: hypothetical protein B7Z59_14450, partial [Acidiphilium sp. 37-67-22]